MFRKWNRVLAFLLSIVLITTTFGSDFTSTFAYAAEDAQDLQNLAAENGDLPEIFEEGQTISDLDEEKNDTETQKETQEKPQEESQEVGDGTISEEEVEKDPETVVTDLEEEASSEGEDEEPAETVPDKEFKESVEMDDGMKISLYAVEGVLPGDAELKVTKISESKEEKIQELIDGEMGESVNVVETFSYDIKIVSPSAVSEDNKEGEVQPEDESTVAVTFEQISEVSDEVEKAETGIAVYHVNDTVTEVEEQVTLPTSAETEEVSFNAEHFSIYTVAIYHNGWDYFWGNNKYSSVRIQTMDMITGQQINAPALNNKVYSTNKEYNEFAPSSIAEDINGYFFQYATKDSSKTAHKITSFMIERGTNALKCKVEGNNQWQNVSSTVYFWYTNRVPVAVYATDGLSSGNLNDHSAELRQLLGLGWVQDDGYFPIGVVWLKQSDIDRTLESRNSRENIDALIDSIGSIDVSYLQNGGGLNASNTVALNKDMIQRDAGGTQKSYKTALLKWYWDGAYQPEHTEQNAPYSGKTNIKEVQGYGHYKYHLDVRFKANAVEYKRVYSENDQITSDSPENLVSYSYLSGTQMTETVVKTVFDSFSIPSSKDGFSYDGLYSDAECTEPFSAFEVSDTTDGYTIYAKYSKTTSHTVTFSMGTQPNATPVPRPKTVTHGQTASKPETDPAVADNTYVFDGWYLGDDKYDFSTLVTTDITLVAHWKENTTTYTVNHYKQKIGGDASRHDTENYSLDKSETSDPVVVNSTQTPAVKTYTGFTAPATQTVTVEVNADGTPKTVVNYYYTRNTYTITYNANGGSGSMEPQPVAYEDTVRISDNSFTREHYRFDGWKDANGNTYEVGATYPGEGAAYANLELFAQWKPLVQVGISAKGDEREYNGQPLKADITVTGLGSNYELRNVTFDVDSITNAGTQEFNITNASAITVYDKVAEKYVTEDFEITVSKQSDILKVNPLTVKVGTGSDTKPFDFTALKDQRIYVNDENKTSPLALDNKGKATFKPLGENSTETIIIYTTSSRIFPGSESNEYAFSFGEGTNKNNYNVIENPDGGKGTLTITTSEDKDKFIIKANDHSFDYDGTAHTVEDPVDDFEILSDPTHGKLTIHANTTGSVTYADAPGTNTIDISTLRIVDEATHTDVTDKFIKDQNNKDKNVIIQSGTLTVNPVRVTVTARDAHKTYDGTALTQEQVGSYYEDGKAYDITGLASGDYEEVVTSGSVKDVKDNKPDENGVRASNHTVGQIKIYRDINGTKTDVTGNYIIDQNSRISGKLYIEPRAYTVTTGTTWKYYDGTPLTYDEGSKIDGIIDSEKNKVEFHAKGSLTDVGDVSNDPDIDGIKWGSALSKVDSHNYSYDDAHSSIGRLTVKVRQDGTITLTADSASKIYDGSALTISTVTPSSSVEGLLDGFEVRATASGTQTNAGSSQNVVDNGFTIVKVDGDKEQNVTAFFGKITTVPGTLTVYPKTVVFTSKGYPNPETKAYDGSALTCSEVEITVPTTGAYDESNTLISGTDKLTTDESHPFTARATGSVTYPDEGENRDGKVVNTIVVTQPEETDLSNYNIIKHEGTLQVTPVSDEDKAQFTLQVGSAEGTYNGTAYVVNGFVHTEKNASGDTDGTKFQWKGHTYTVTGLTVAGSATNAKVKDQKQDELWVADSYSVSASGKAVILDENNKDVTSQFAVPEILPGTITINPKTVELTSASWERVYNGKAFTNADGLADAIKKAKAEGREDDALNLQNTEGVTGLDGFITREDGTKEGVKLSFDGSITVPGDTANTFSVASYENGTLETNYNIVTTPGKLSVISSNAHYVVKVVANSDTVVYDGKPHSVSGFKKVIVVDVDNNNKETEYEVKDGKLAFKLNGADFTIEGLEAKMAKESYTDVLKDDDDILSRPVVVQRGEVVVKQGNDPVTGEFTVQTVDGSLTINPRKITLKSVSYEKLYDGVALSTQWLVVNKKIKESEKVAISFPEGQDGAFVGTDGIVSYNFTGSQLLPGGSEGNNTFTYALVEGTKSQNYDIKKEFGTLTVKSRKGVDPFILNVKAASKEATYTGQPIEASGFDESDYDNMEVVKLEDGTTALQFTAESGAVFYITGLEVSRSETDVLVAKDKRGNNKKDRQGNWVVDSYSVPVTGTETAVVVDAAGNTVTDEFAFGKVKAGKLKINPIKIKFTSGSAEKEYDGDPLTNNEVKVDGAFAQGEKAVFTVTGTETLPTKKNVSHNNKFTYELVNAKETNYDVKTEFGTLKVTNRSGANKWEIELKGNSATYYYNGDSQKVSGFEKMSFEFNGHTYYVSGVTSSAKGKDVLYKDGKVVAKDTKIEGKPKVKDEAGHDVTKSFKVTVKEGTLLINPRPVTLTSADGRKKYDGTPLTTFDLVKKGELDKEVTVGGMGFVKNHGKKIRYTVTGSQTIVGSSPNEFTYKFNNSIKDIEKNYAITKINGTLTVETRGADNRFEVVVVANSDEFLYDGTEHSVSGFKEVRVKVGENKYDTYQVKGGVLEFKLNGETFKITDVSTIAGTATDVMLNEVTDETGAKKYAEAPAAVVSVSDTSLAKVTDSNNNPVTSEFAVYSENGTLTINRRKVTLAAGSASKDFDGKALTCPEYIIKTGEGIDGFAVYTKDGKEVNEKNGITVTTSGSALRPEDSPAENEIAKVDFDGVIAKASNYIVTTEKGELTINSLEKKIVLDITLELDQDGGNNKEVTYNGKQQSMDVTIGITPKKITETEETQTTTEGGNTETPSPITQNSDDNDEGDTSNLSAMIGKLMSLGTITVYAAEGEDIFEDAEQLKYNSTATFTYGDTTFVVSGIVLEGGVGTDVGEYPVSINLDNLSVSVGKVVDGEVVADKDASVDEFEFNVIKPETRTEGNNVVGVLNIVEKEITVSTGSASKDYDGNPLTSNVASIDGIVNGETYKITATGSRTEVGTSKNTYKIDWWAPENNDYTAKKTNYKIVGENLGDLRVDRVSSGGGGGDDTPVFFTLAAPAPSGAVLGAQRVVGDGPAVLGARRSSTDDNTNSMARVFAMVAAAAIAVTVMITGKKKKEEEEG